MTARSRPRLKSVPQPEAAPDTPSEGQYREIPRCELSANPLNGRRKLTGIDELAASIREVGILEPLLVVPSEGGGLVIAAGHRRFAAAELAELATVPCIVRTDLDEAQVLQTAIVENTHRENLTYLEEAEQLQRLMTLRAVTVRDLAKAVGRSAQYVSGRLSLLALPESAQQALDDGRITLETAQQLADLAEYPEIVDELVGPEGVDLYLLEVAVRRVTVERECARLVEEAAAKGQRLIEQEPHSLGYRYVATMDLSPHQQAAHTRRGCHAVYLDRSYDKPRLVAVCTDPDKHRPTQPSTADAGPDGPGPTDAPAGVNPADAGAATTGGDRRAQLEQQAREREQAEAETHRNRKRVAKARREFLEELASRRIKRGEAAVFAFGAILERASSNHLAWVGKSLGLEAAAGTYGQTDWRTPSASWAAENAEQLLKAAFLICCAWAEDRISPWARGYDAFAARYVEVLASFGYEPDPYETEQIAEGRRVDQPVDEERDAADPADDDADT
jgi:ParB/RepB/Spo0J family partition protein